MSYFKGLKLTRQGEQLLAKVNGNIGEILTFTRGELGSGRIDSEDEVYYLTALKNKWGELAITEIARTGEDETQVRIETQFTNAEWTEEKILREIGIYAKGKESSEILFAYSNAGENYDKIPIPQDNPQSFLIGITFKISTATKVDATISFSGFVTIEKLEEELAKKEDKILVKNTAFNKNFGLLEGEVLEGHRLAQALGLEFAGELNNSDLKQAGKAYWDNVNKSIYKCLVNTTLNYADASYFEALSNDDLLNKLQNLTNKNRFQFEIGGITVVLTEFGKIVMCLIQHKGGIVDATLPTETIPVAFRGEYTVYLSAPCITGAPYIALKDDGGVEFRINGATFQASTKTTTYFLTQSYLSKLY